MCNTYPKGCHSSVTDSQSQKALYTSGLYRLLRSLCCVMQSRQVRQSAAENLGELTRMSMRLDQLASDLINNSKAADSVIQVWNTWQPSAWFYFKVSTTNQLSLRCIENSNLDTVVSQN